MGVAPVPRGLARLGQQEGFGGDPLLRRVDVEAGGRVGQEDRTDAQAQAGEQDAGEIGQGETAE